MSGVGRSIFRILGVYKSGRASFIDEDEDISATPDLVEPGNDFGKSDVASRLDVIEALRQAAPDSSSACPILAESIVEGVAYHHAGNFYFSHLLSPPPPNNHHHHP